MPLMDEFREERAALKNGTFKEKLQYFWDYYKWHTIAVIVGIFCIVSFARNILDNKDAALSAALLNCTPLTEDPEPFFQAYAKYAGIDLDKYELRFDSDLHLSMTSHDQSTANTIQKLMVTLAANDLDVMMGNGDAFSYYANSGTFTDLREVFSPEQLSEYGSDLYYIDMSVLKELETLQSELQDTSSVKIPDPRKPEEMQIPIPVAVFIPADKFQDSFYFQNMEDGIAIGIIVNSPEPDNALALIEFLMQP